MSPGRLQGVLFQAPLTGRRSQADPGYDEDFMSSHLAWECLTVSPQQSRNRWPRRARCGHLCLDCCPSSLDLDINWLSYILYFKNKWLCPGQIFVSWYNPIVIFITFITRKNTCQPIVTVILTLPALLCVKKLPELFLSNTESGRQDRREHDQENNNRSVQRKIPTLPNHRYGYKSRVQLLYRPLLGLDSLFRSLFVVIFAVFFLVNSQM